MLITGKQLLKDEGQEAAEITRVLYEVLESCYDNMSTLFTKDINQIAEKMSQNGIITSHLRNDPSYDAIILCFRGGLNFMKNQGEIEEHCTNFIKSINEMKEKNDDDWGKLAMAVENRWKVAIKKKLDIEFKVHVEKTN